MASKQVRDVFDHVRKYHRRVCEVYEDAEQHEDDERVRLLLEYLRRHEQHVEDVLSEYEQDERFEGVLNTWLKFAPDDLLDDVFEQIHVEEDHAVEDVVADALRFDQALLELYKDLAESAPTPRIRELFADLAQLEESQEHQYARTALEEA